MKLILFEAFMISDKQKIFVYENILPCSAISFILLNVIATEYFNGLIVIIKGIKILKLDQLSTRRSRGLVNSCARRVLQLRDCSFFVIGPLLSRRKDWGIIVGFNPCKIWYSVEGLSHGWTSDILPVFIHTETYSPQSQRHLLSYGTGKILTSQLINQIRMLVFLLPVWDRWLNRYVYK